MLLIAPKFIIIISIMVIRYITYTLKTRPRVLWSRDYDGELVTFSMGFRKAAALLGMSGARVPEGPAARAHRQGEVQILLGLLTGYMQPCHNCSACEASLCRGEGKVHSIGRALFAGDLCGTRMEVEHAYGEETASRSCV
jgi:hypothetical protein